MVPHPLASVYPSKTFFVRIVFNTVRGQFIDLVLLDLTELKKSSNARHLHWQQGQAPANGKSL
jgi:hypothetical protein